MFWEGALRIGEIVVPLKANRRIDTLMESRRMFLLGGQDLEMQTIESVLRGNGASFENHNLRWDNAFLSSYKDVVEEYAGNPEVTLYGVELMEDIAAPANYVRIDHHNDFSGMPSSLEQVMTVLGQPMNRHQKLVAANDARYIPGMESLGATRTEIEEIRRADRRAQGVTDEDERAAELAVKQASGDASGLYVVRTGIHRFSPICDRLYPYRRLLIYNDSEFMFYGEGVPELRALLAREIVRRTVFFGGGDSGYIGCAAGKYTPSEIGEYIDRIKSIFSI